MNANVSLTTPAVSVDIEGVNLSYGTNHVLKDVSLAIQPGEFFAFLGPSGCGKTTLLRLIAGFNQADTGHVRIGGKEITDQALMMCDLPGMIRGLAVVGAPDCEALWREITRTAAPGARVIFRTAAEESLLPGRVDPAALARWDYRAEESKALHSRDRSSIYGGFHLYDGQNHQADLNERKAAVMACWEPAKVPTICPSSRNDA